MKESAFNKAKSTLFKATEKIVPKKIQAITALVSSLSMSTIAGCAAQDLKPQTACNCEEKQSDMAPEIEVSAWEQFVEEHGLSSEEANILQEKFEDNEEKMGKCIEYLIENPNRSTKMAKLFARLGDDENCSLVGNGNFDAQVFEAMEYDWNDNYIGLSNLLNNSKFDTDLFSALYRGLDQSHYKRNFNTKNQDKPIEIIQKIFGHSKFSTSGARAVADMQYLRAELIHFAMKTYGNPNLPRPVIESKQAAIDLYMKDPSLVPNFKDCAIKATEEYVHQEKFTQIYEVLDPLNKIAAETPNKHAIDLTKRALYAHNPDIYPQLLQSIYSLVTSDRIAEINDDMDRIFLNPMLMQGLGHALKNPNFQKEHIAILEEAITEIDENYPVSLNNYLQHQDLTKTKQAIKLIKKYDEEDEMGGYLEEYFKSPSFSFARFSRLNQLIKRHPAEKKALKELFQAKKYDEKVQKLASILLYEVPRDVEFEKKAIKEPDKNTTDRASALHHLKIFIDSDLYVDWMLNYPIDKRLQASEVVQYLSHLVSHPKFKQVNTWEEAGNFAEKHDIDLYNPVIYFNLAFGISIYGFEEAETLYSNYNILYFSRYPESVLTNMLKPTAGNKKPAIIAATSTDWNGGFISIDSIPYLEKDFDVRVYEITNEQQLYSVIPNGGVLVVAAHGSPRTAAFSQGWSETASLDTSDRYDLRKIKNRPDFIIMESCSTGKDEKAIGAMLSEELKTKSFGPKEDSALAKIEVENGIIKNVTYTVPGHIFENGKIVGETEAHK